MALSSPFRAFGAEAALRHLPRPRLRRGSESLGIDMSPIDAAAILGLLARTAAAPKETIAHYVARAGEKN